MTEEANETPNPTPTPETPETAPRPDKTPPAAAAPAARRSGNGVLTLLVLLVLLLGGALAWLWWDGQQRFEQLRADVAAQLRTSQDTGQSARVIAKETQEQLSQLQRTVAGLEVKVLNAQSQQEALEAIYLEMSRSRDDWLLAEAEQTLNIAAQQLQLAGNVAAALTALQAVDARLARQDRPQFMSIRKVLARDIQRLQATPTLDVTGMTLRIDQLLDQVDAMPMAIEAQAREAATAAAPSAEGEWWKDTLRATWYELKQLIRVERLDAHDPSLLAPEQRYFLKENLKLRLLHARLALLQRDEQAFRNDIQSAIDWLKRYFDADDAKVTGALATLEQLRNAAVDVELPSIIDSLNAVRSFKMPQDGNS